MLVDYVSFLSAGHRLLALSLGATFVARSVVRFTKVLFLDPAGSEMHAANKTTATPLAQLPYESLCPGAAALEALQKSYR